MNVSVGRHRSMDQCQRAGDPRPTPLAISDEVQFNPEAVQCSWPRSCRVRFDSTKPEPKWFGLFSKNAAFLKCAHAWLRMLLTILKMRGKR